jgi:hypothetical protein
VRGDKAVEVVADRTRRDAVYQAATVLYGTITAVTATGVTVDLDGSVVPNVPVLHPFVPRVNAVVRIVSQGAQLLVIGGVKPNPTPVPTSASTNSTFNVTATSFAALSTPVRASFVAPPSGRAVMHVKARLTPTATARCNVSLRLLTSGLATITEDIVILEAPAGGGTMSAGGHWYVSGLVAGTTYYGDVVAATGTAGQTVTVGYVRLMIVPEA